MKLSVFTPEKKLVTDQEIEDVLVPGFKGELHILPGHAPTMTKLSTGVLKWRLKGEVEYHKAVVSSGYCEVNPEGVIVLAEHATLAEDVTPEKYVDEIKALETKLGNQFLDDKNWEETQRRLAELKTSLSFHVKH